MQSQTEKLEAHGIDVDPAGRAALEAIEQLETMLADNWRRPTHYIGAVLHAAEVSRFRLRNWIHARHIDLDAFEVDRLTTRQRLKFSRRDAVMIAVAARLSDLGLKGDDIQAAIGEIMEIIDKLATTQTGFDGEPILYLVPTTSGIDIVPALQTPIGLRTEHALPSATISLRITQIMSDTINRLPSIREASDD